MNVNRRWLYGGVFLIALGAVLLAAQGDAVDGDTIAQALRYWPVLVIALGVGLLLRLTRFDVAGGMLAAAVPGLLLGGLIAAGPVVAHESGLECSNARAATLTPHQGSFAGTADVDLELSCGEVTVTTGAGSDWRLEAGNGTGTGPTVVASAGRLSVASSVTGHPWGFVRGADAWQLTLPSTPSIDLAAEVNAGRGRFDLAGARLGEVELIVNAGEITADLEGATLGHLGVRVSGGSAAVGLPSQDLDADLEVTAGALRICVPDDLGVRITHQGALTSTTYAGLVRNGASWESPGYATAGNHADVTVTATVASVDVNPIGGCK